MTGTGSFTAGLSDVMSLWVDEDYARALDRVEDLRSAWPGNAQLLVLRAQLIQLADEPAASLADAQRALEQAVEFDPQSPAAAIELGHFLDNVEDDPQAAARAFAQGIATARRRLIEGLLGRARSLLQLDRRDEAAHDLDEAARLIDAEPAGTKGPFASRLDELLKELGQAQSV